MIDFLNRLSSVQRYAIGFALASVTTALQWTIWLMVGAQIPYMLFMATIPIAAVLLGPGPASLVGIAGLISGTAMVSTMLPGNNPLTNRVMLTYVVVSAFFVGLGGIFRKASARAAIAEQRLFDLRLNAEQRISVYEQRFRTVLDTSAVSFAIIDPVKNDDGRIVDFRFSYLNAAASKIFGQPAEALIGKCVGETFPHAWDEPGSLERYIAVSVGGEAQSFERHSSAYGIDGWFHVVASPLGESVVVWFADLTPQKELEQALREADSSKDAFIATLAHELRNPLAPIRQAASLINAPNAKPEHRQWAAEVIDRQAQHMALLLDDLLDLSRITRGVLTLKKSLVAFDTIVKAAVEAASPLIESKNHRLTVRMPKQDMHVEVDEVRLTQILTNLLTNAAKYTEPGGQIMLAAESEADELTIWVSDTGIGLKPEQLTEIFKMFTQVKSSEERLEGGLGIGLAVTRGLVALHGGTIEAKSLGPGKGSQFTVRLPINTRRPAIPDPVVPIAPIPEKKCRVLIADDNCDAANILATLVEMEGHDVLVAYDGEAALDAYGDFDPDIALLDIGMPKLTGTEVARRIRARENAKKHIPLVALTGWGQDRDKTEAFEAGFSHHLTKPVDFAAVREIIVQEATGDQAH